MKTLEGRCWMPVLMACAALAPIERHGITGYRTHGCRCGVCCAVAAEYRNRWRGRTVERTAGIEEMAP